MLVGRLVTALLMVAGGAADASCSRPRERASTCCSRSAPAPGCSTCCAGSGGASTRGARSRRWSVRSSSRSASSSPARRALAIPAHASLLITVAVTTVVWLAVTYLTPPTDREVLVAFYERVRPAGPGWAPQCGAKPGSRPAQTPLSADVGVAVRVRGRLRRAVRDGAWLYGAAAARLVFLAWSSRRSAPLASRDCCRASSPRRLDDRAQSSSRGASARACGSRRRRARSTRRQAAAADAGLKAMIPIGRPFLDYILSELADAGVARRLSRHRPRARRSRGAITRRGAAAADSVSTFAVQEEPRGTADAVLAAEAWTGGEPFLVMNGDNYYPVPALRALAALSLPGLVGVPPRRAARRRPDPARADRCASRCSISTAAGCGAIVEKPGPGRWRRASTAARTVSMNCWRFDRGSTTLPARAAIAARRAGAADGRADGDRRRAVPGRGRAVGRGRPGPVRPRGHRGGCRTPGRHRGAVVTDAIARGLSAGAGRSSTRRRSRGRRAGEPGRRRRGVAALRAGAHRGARQAHGLRRRPQPHVRRRARLRGGLPAEGRSTCCGWSTRNDGRHVEFRVEASIEPAVGHWSNYPMTVARRLARNFGAARARRRHRLLEHAAKGRRPEHVECPGDRRRSLVLVEVNELGARPAFRAAIADDLQLAGYPGRIENGRAFGALAGDHGVGTTGGSEDHTAILLSTADRLTCYRYFPVTRLRQVSLPDDYAFVVAASGIAADKTGTARGPYNRASAMVAELLERWRADDGRADETLSEAVDAMPDAVGAPPRHRRRCRGRAGARRAAGALSRRGSPDPARGCRGARGLAARRVRVAGGPFSARGGGAAREPGARDGHARAARAREGRTRRVVVWRGIRRQRVGAGGGSTAPRRLPASGSTPIASVIPPPRRERRAS